MAHPDWRYTIMATNPTSIRQICLAGFLSRTPRTVIAEQIKTAHPTSMAATKSTAHIAWHYGDMKKRGLLAAILGEVPAAVIVAPVIVAPVVVAGPSEADLIAAQAAEMAAKIDAQLAD